MMVGMLIMALFWIGVIVLVGGGLTHVFSARQPRVELGAEEILKQRYARGEISREEFVQAREGAKKELKKGSTGMGAQAPRQVAAVEGMVPTGMPRMPAIPVLDSLGTSVSSAGVPTTKLPSLEELLAERGPSVRPTTSRPAPKDWRNGWHRRTTTETLGRRSWPPRWPWAGGWDAEHHWRTRAAFPAHLARRVRV